MWHIISLIYMRYEIIVITPMICMIYLWQFLSQEQRMFSSRSGFVKNCFVLRSIPTSLLASNTLYKTIQINFAPTVILYVHKRTHLFCLIIFFKRFSYCAQEILYPSLGILSQIVSYTNHLRSIKFNLVALFYFSNFEIKNTKQYASGVCIYDSKRTKLSSIRSNMSFMFLFTSQNKIMSEYLSNELFDNDSIIHNWKQYFKTNLVNMRI